MAIALDRIEIFSFLFLLVSPFVFAEAKHSVALTQVHSPGTRAEAIAYSGVRLAEGLAKISVFVPHQI
eukprot:6172596-Pleurochrysis_carterae.AAC.2